jgi:hypothetical protein
MKRSERFVVIEEGVLSSDASSSVVRLVDEKHASDKHVPIAVFLDQGSVRHGGIVSPSVEAIRKAGALVALIDMSPMPDSDLFFSALWRPLFSWWGNSPKKPWLSDPYGESGVAVPLRSWLAYLNMKSSESHTFSGDVPEGKKFKRRTIVLSSEFDRSPGATGRTALVVDDKLWRDVYARQKTVAEFSNAGLPLYNASDIDDADGKLSVTLLGPANIKETLITRIRSLSRGDSLSIAMRYLSDRDVISEIKDAGTRGATVRIILDPNEDDAGRQLYGMPNRPVAKEFMTGLAGGTTVRWCEPHALPCDSRLILGRSASSTFMISGGADLTRRDLGGHNLETDVLVESNRDFAAFRDASQYFERLWGNDGNIFTVNYEDFQDDTLWKSSVYRMMERTGISRY